MGIAVAKCSCRDFDRCKHEGEAEVNATLDETMVFEEMDQEGSSTSPRTELQEHEPDARRTSVSATFLPANRSKFRRTTMGFPSSEPSTSASTFSRQVSTGSFFRQASSTSDHNHQLSVADRKFISDALLGNKSLRRILGNKRTVTDTLGDYAERLKVSPMEELSLGTTSEDECVYIVQQGKFVTSRQEQFARSISSGSEGQPVKMDNSQEIKPGECFGDVALLLGDASGHRPIMRAVEPSVVWRILWFNFKLVMQGNDDEQISEYVKYLDGLDVLSSSSIFEKEMLAKALSEVLFVKDETVFQAGDAATSFYILLDGTVDVWVDGSLLKTIEASTENNVVQYFGDRALLANEPRRWTVVVTSENAQALEMAKDDFVELLGPLSDILKRKRIESDSSKHPYVRYLDNMSILNALSAHQKEILAKALTTQDFERGDAVFRCGDPATAFYILLDGELEVFKEGAFLKKIEADSTKNLVQHFGDRALLEHEPRRWTVKVSSPNAKTLMMDRKNFLELLGSLEDMIESKKRVSCLNSTVTKIKIPKDNLEVVKTIGAGKFGPIELCKHSITGDTYALKSCGKGLLAQRQVQQNILRERANWLMLDYPMIIKLYATYREPQNVFFLMELAQGGDLPRIYDKEKLYGSAKHARFYIAGVVLALRHLHSFRIVHRNVESSNILINARGYPKLTGFHASKVVSGKTSTTCGTLEYMAPEMLMGMRYTRAVDWWALGVLTFELMARMFPFGSGFNATSNIIRGVAGVEFPKSCNAAASSFIQMLLQEEPSSRLGMRQTALDNHAWLSSFKWDAMRGLRLIPPYRPKLSGGTDVSYFNVNTSDLPGQVDYVEDGTKWDKEFEDM